MNPKLTLSESIRQKARRAESADDPLEATVLSVTPLQIHIVELDLTVDEENITLSTVARRCGTRRWSSMRTTRLSVG